MIWIWTAFILGFAGSAHCLAMCGPLLIGVQKRQLLHHAGRLFSYSIVGLVFGLLGKVIIMASYQQALSIISGSILLLWVIFSIFPIRSSSIALLRYWSKFNALFYKPISHLSPNLRSVSMGILNGFLPCGLVYVAATASLQGGSIPYSVSYMLFFGAGTLPALVGLGFAGQKIGPIVRQRFRNAAPYFVTVLACLFILRGLALNIPYVSPKITQSSSGHIKCSCCHPAGEMKIEK